MVCHAILSYFNPPVIATISSSFPLLLFLQLWPCVLIYEGNIRTQFEMDVDLERFSR